MVVVAENRIAVQLDREALAEEEESFLDPGAAMLVGATGQTVGPAQPGATHASRVDMVDAGMLAIDQMCPRQSH
jgi:hypothetical protein